jgi:hypothetical protein
MIHSESGPWPITLPAAGSFPSLRYWGVGAGQPSATRSHSRSASRTASGPLGTFFRYISDNGTWIARCDDPVTGKEEPVDLSGVAISSNGIELSIGAAARPTASTKPRSGSSVGGCAQDMLDRCGSETFYDGAAEALEKDIATPAVRWLQCDC